MLSNKRILRICDPCNPCDTSLIAHLPRIFRWSSGRVARGTDQLQVATTKWPKKIITTKPTMSLRPNCSRPHDAGLASSSTVELTIESSWQSNSLFSASISSAPSLSDRQCRIQPCMYSSIDQFSWSVLLISSVDQFLWLILTYLITLWGSHELRPTIKKEKKKVCCWKQRKNQHSFRGEGASNSGLTSFWDGVVFSLFQQTHPKCWTKTPALAFYFPIVNRMPPAKAIAEMPSQPAKT